MLLLLLLLRGRLLLLLRLLHDLLDKLQLLLREAIVAGAGRRDALQNNQRIYDMGKSVIDLQYHLAITMHVTNSSRSMMHNHVQLKQV